MCPFIIPQSQVSRFLGSFGIKNFLSTSSGQVRGQSKGTTLITRLVLEGGLTSLENKNWQLTHQRVEHMSASTAATLQVDLHPSTFHSSRFDRWAIMRVQIVHRTDCCWSCTKASHHRALAWKLSKDVALSVLWSFFFKQNKQSKAGTFQKHNLWFASLSPFSTLPFPHYCSLWGRLHILNFDKWQINSAVQRIAVELSSLPQPPQTVYQIIFYKNFIRNFLQAHTHGHTSTLKTHTPS